MLRILTSLAAMSTAAAPFLFLPAANAQLASQSSEFSGSVPPLCRVADPVNTSTPMSFDGNQLAGTTNAFSFESNGNIALQLRQVQILNAPDQTAGYTWAAGLRVNNGNQIAGSTQDGASASIPYANGLTANDDFQMTLRVSAPGNNLMRQGNYVALVTTDCIVN